MPEVKQFVIDFDSTFTRVEAFDILCQMAAPEGEREEAAKKIQQITDRCMEGELSFRQALQQRLDILNARREHLPAVIEELKSEISPSFERNKEFFDEHREHVHIVSNGFVEIIAPVVAEFGISEDQVHANSLIFDDEGRITGFDEENVLSQDGGKVHVIESLRLPGEVYVIGDGYNDYEIREAGLATKFYGYTENVAREVVLQHADHITPTLDEFLYEHNLNRALSYPKNRIKVLLLEGVHPLAEEMFKEEGYQVEVHPTGMDEDELLECIEGVSILGIRSKTHVSERVLKKAKRLLVVGAFCIGTNQIDLEACMRHGVAVFNAPFSNTRSVVELVVGELILLMRRVPDKMAAMQEGRWEKSSDGSHEVRGKNLGIIGYGNIGSQLSVVAESLGMNVYFYDLADKLPLGNATRCDSMEQLLSVADVVSLHVDGRPQNDNLIDEQAFSSMKDGVVFLNLSRGSVVDVSALAESLESGKVGGAALDVYPEEPKTRQATFDGLLRGSSNVIMTPHVGGSTIEAQQDIGTYVPSKIIRYINTGSTANSVNFPNVQLPELEQIAHRFMHIHHNKPGVLAEIGQTLANHNINVLGQYLKTNEIIGYVITDIDRGYDEEVRRELRNIEHTIRFRVLY